MTDRFDILVAPLRNLAVLRRKPIGDSRGLLERLFCSTELEQFVGGKSIVQINRSVTEKRGTVRGMHYQQPPFAETKLVSCLRGEVFDVAVDVRHDSDTFLQWHAEVLSESNHQTFLIPEGFAHGFQTLTDSCELLYFHTAPYRPQSEAALNPKDPLLAIEWPEPITEMSLRDSSHPLLTKNFRGVSP